MLYIVIQNKIKNYDDNKSIDVQPNWNIFVCMFNIENV